MQFCHPGERYFGELFCFHIIFLGPIKKVNHENQNCNAKVADESGCINLCLWNEAAEYFSPGDVCCLKQGSTSVHKGQMSLVV